MSSKSYEVSLCQRAPDREPMNALLGEYYELMISRLQNMGGSVSGRAEAALKEFWDEVDLFLPPQGRLYVARDANGDWIGCGSLKTIDADKGELKRLYVKPEARGSGLGRHLVELRIQAAREMGLSRLLVDTLKVNVEMQGLYAKLGFEEIEVCAESTTHRMMPELRPFMCFFGMDLK